MSLPVAKIPVGSSEYFRLRHYSASHHGVPRFPFLRLLNNYLMASSLFLPPLSNLLFLTPGRVITIAGNTPNNIVRFFQLHSGIIDDNLLLAPNLDRLCPECSMAAAASSRRWFISSYVFIQCHFVIRYSFFVLRSHTLFLFAQISNTFHCCNASAFRP